VEISQLLLTRAAILCVLNHAHNRDFRWQVGVTNPPAEWICVPEELASHRLAYQDDSLSGRIVLRAEIAAGQEWDSHGLDEPGTDPVHMHPGVGVRACPTLFRREAGKV